ncbi:hypothetical protein Nepgr_018434 [Nepenthes gracilis]|uniref:Uncharacterized protein n=1 Tax=Nepenthes gracilis TaxID=150966 RepID=A0AAD3SRC6_NEPGR|nr:hypothetical protein Nepgr_018434 [Nepenthes gracilis]
MGPPRLLDNFDWIVFLVTKGLFVSPSSINPTRRAAQEDILSHERFTVSCFASLRCLHFLFELFMLSFSDFKLLHVIVGVVLFNFSAIPLPCLPSLYPFILILLGDFSHSDFCSSIILSLALLCIAPGVADRRLASRSSSLAFSLSS